MAWGNRIRPFLNVAHYIPNIYLARKAGGIVHRLFSSAPSSLGPRTQKILELYGDTPIVAARIGGQSLGTFLGKFATSLTGIDIGELFHLYIKLTLADGNILLFEKNEMGPRLLLNDNRSHSYEMNVPLMQYRVITPNVAIENTKALLGDYPFYHYDAFRSNCQDLIVGFLVSNHLDSKEVLEKVKQMEVNELDKNPIVRDIGFRNGFLFVTDLSRAIKNLVGARSAVFIDREKRPRDEVSDSDDDEYDPETPYTSSSEDE